MKDVTPSSSQLFHQAETKSSLLFIGTAGAFMLQGELLQTQRGAQRGGCQRFTTQQTGREVQRRTRMREQACLKV